MIHSIALSIYLTPPTHLRCRHCAWCRNWWRSAGTPMAPRDSPPCASRKPSRAWSTRKTSRYSDKKTIKAANEGRRHTWAGAPIYIFIILNSILGDNISNPKWGRRQYWGALFSSSTKLPLVAENVFALSLIYLCLYFLWWCEGPRI